MKIFEHRGDRKHFKATGPVIILTLILLVVGTIGYYRGSYQNEFIAHASTANELQEVKEYTYEISEQNEALKAKLEFSAKQVTNETTKELVRFYIHKYFPQSEWATAEAISKCESGMNPNSLNDKNKNGTADRGAWQINTVHAKRFEKMYGIKWELGAHDIDLSTQYARFLWDHSGWNPWVCLGIIKK